MNRGVKVDSTPTAVVQLLVRFGVSLERTDIRPTRPHGPLFHRWLPNGERDAITIKDETFILHLWFEQWGFMDHSFIRFEYKRKEVDSDTVPRQAVLDAGPLYGNIQLDITHDKLASIIKGREGDPVYEALGKLIVKRVIESHVLRILRVIKYTFGQYWVEIPESWDSKKMSLGYYCQQWGMRWSIDKGATWSDFSPTKRERAPITIVADAGVGRDLIRESDWRGLESTSVAGFEPSLPAVLISRAHELADMGLWRHAFVEGVTALELAIQTFYRDRARTDKVLQESFQSFWELPLRTQLLTVALAAQNEVKMAIEDLRAALRAIDIRNAIVHEGSDKNESDEKVLRALLRVAGGLMPGPRLKLPPMPSGNALFKMGDES